MPTPLVELALNNRATPDGPEPSPRRTAALSGFSDRLLRLFGSAIPEPSRPSSGTRFAQRVEDWRVKIRTETDGAALEAIAVEILAECATHADRFHDDLDQREAEVAELMSVLRQVIEALSGDSKRFEAELNRSTESMKKMVDVEDIREIKRVLSKEVDAIKKAAAERQASDSKRVESLNAQVEALESSLREARTRALTDPLTGVPNRGALEEELQDALRRAARQGKPFCVAMVDLDDLKKINDTHGHQVGDRVLIACARLLQEGTTSGDLVARYGGEEFGVILQKPTAEAGAEVLQAVLKRIPPAYQYKIDQETKSVGFSFSAGITEWSAGDSVDALVKRADDALYEAKRKGKKRVEVRHRGLLNSLVGWAGPSGRRQTDRRGRPSPHDPVGRAEDGPSAPGNR